MLGEKRRCGDRLVLEVRDGLEALRQVGRVSGLVYRTCFLFQDRSIGVDSSD